MNQSYDNYSHWKEFLILTQVLVLAKSDCTQLPAMVDEDYCCAAPDFTDRVLLKQCEDEGVVKRLENATMACVGDSDYSNG